MIFILERKKSLLNPNAFFCGFVIAACCFIHIKQSQKCACCLKFQYLMRWWSLNECWCCAARPIYLIRERRVIYWYARFVGSEDFFCLGSSSGAVRLRASSLRWNINRRGVESYYCLHSISGIPSYPERWRRMINAFGKILKWKILMFFFFFLVKKII